MPGCAAALRQGSPTLNKPLRFAYGHLGEVWYVLLKVVLENSDQDGGFPRYPQTRGGSSVGYWYCLCCFDSYIHVVASRCCYAVCWDDIGGRTCRKEKSSLITCWIYNSSIASNSDKICCTRGWHTGCPVDGVGAGSLPRSTWRRSSDAWECGVLGAYCGIGSASDCHAEIHCGARGYCYVPNIAATITDQGSPVDGYQSGSYWC